MSADYVDTLLVGDLNVHHAHLLKVSSSVSLEGSRLFKFCTENDFRQLVKEPTHKVGQLLHFGLTDIVEIETAKVADHNVIRFIINLSVLPHAQRSRRVDEYKQTAWIRICEDFANRD